MMKFSKKHKNDYLEYFHTNGKILFRGFGDTGLNGYIESHYIDFNTLEYTNEYEFFVI